MITISVLFKVKKWKRILKLKHLTYLRNLIKNYCDSFARGTRRKKITNEKTGMVLLFSFNYLKG